MTDCAGCGHIEYTHDNLDIMRRSCLAAGCLCPDFESSED